MNEQAPITDEQHKEHLSEMEALLLQKNDSLRPAHSSYLEILEADPALAFGALRQARAISKERYGNAA